jgi:hypothetical protein
MTRASQESIWDDSCEGLEKPKWLMGQEETTYIKVVTKMVESNQNNYAKML